MGKDYSQYKSSHPFAYAVSMRYEKEGWFNNFFHALMNFFGLYVNRLDEDIIKHLVYTEEWKKLEKELNNKLEKLSNNQLILNAFNEYEEKLSTFIIKSIPSVSLIYI